MSIQRKFQKSSIKERLVIQLLVVVYNSTRICPSPRAYLAQQLILIQLDQERLRKELILYQLWDVEVVLMLEVAIG